MNRSMILYVVGHVIMLEGVMLLLPCLVSLIYEESEGIDYLVMAVICMLLGAIIVKHKPKVNVFYLKEGCIATALSWIALSIFGALPMCISGDIPSFTDALFETISGFTTTGASILNDVEAYYPGRRCSGEALHTGSVAWVCWCFCLRYCRLVADQISI